MVAALVLVGAAGLAYFEAPVVESPSEMLWLCPSLSLSAWPLDFQLPWR
jgi:hypothetical protein